MKKYKNQVEENEAARLGRNQAQRLAGTRPSDGGRRTNGATVTEIETGGIAAELGIVPGSRLIQIDDRPVRDAIQLRMADVAERISLTVIQPDGAQRIFDIEKDPFDSLGLGTDAELFDGVTRCKNKCPFCFVDQLPPRRKDGKNLRRTLYVRDDDYRLSFMHGHYITLTNLSEEDYRRIVEEKLTPLCVSVQATDPATRVRMLGNAGAGNILERLRFLIDNGIQLNTQIVLCPGINDGAILERSVRDLMGLWPGVESVAVVPVGLTKYLPGDRGMRTVSPAEAEGILAQLKPLQRQCKKAFGSNFVYASDEMYLLAGRPMPGTAFYDSFPQYANGVGISRAFLDEVAKLRRRKARPRAMPRITMVTGTLASGVLKELAVALREQYLADAEVVEVADTFWGGNVGCAGLLMGEEVLDALRGRDCGQTVFLPPDSVDNQRRMLDDITLDQISAELGSTVRSDALGPLHMAGLLAAS